jgi:hypothetical protein
MAADDPRLRDRTPRPKFGGMHTSTELLGFVDIELGARRVRIPIRSADPEVAEAEPALASFVASGTEGAIVVRAEVTSPLFDAAVRTAAEEAERYFSRKLLN